MAGLAYKQDATGEAVVNLPSPHTDNRSRGVFNHGSDLSAGPSPGTASGDDPLHLLVNPFKQVLTPLPLYNPLTDGHGDGFKMWDLQLGDGLKVLQITQFFDAHSSSAQDDLTLFTQFYVKEHDDAMLTRDQIAVAWEQHLQRRVQFKDMLYSFVHPSLVLGTGDQLLANTKVISEFY